MPDARPSARASWLQDLHDSAPIRDLIRPGVAERTPVGLPVGLPDGAPSGATRPQRLAAAALLLSCQAGREHLTLAVRDDGGLRALDLLVAAEAPLTELIAQAGHALRPGQGRPLDPAAPLDGVVVDLRAAGAGGPAVAALAADLVLVLPDDGAPPGVIGDSQVYLPGTLAALARQMTTALQAAREPAARSTSPATWLAPSEQERILRGFNALTLALPPGQTMGGLIDAQLDRTPDAVCAVHGDRSLTCQQLATSAGQLASRLVELGVQRGQFVCIVDDRGLDFVVALLAIWRAGAAYVPVDPGYPEDRVRYMLSDSEARVAIVGARALRRYRQALADCPLLADVVCPAPDDDIDLAPGQRLHDLRTLATSPPLPGGGRATSADPAYMVYTSGSTGRPKGAIVRHDGAVNHLHAQAQALSARSISRILQSAPSSSDISVWQFVAPLAFGGTCVIIDDPTDVAGLFDQVKRHGVHLIELVPAVMRYVVEFAASLPAAGRELPHLHWAMVTGESAPVDLVNGWLSLYPAVPVVNAYGPTEAADDVCQAIIRAPLPDRLAAVPIGRPLANLQLYVLDPRLQPLPVGAPGEICIAGVGVGPGYWKQPEKTSQAFVPNPFGSTPDSMLYRTGDLGRWRDDGSLECLGRIDHQVKVRGQRIELQEIETVLRAHAGLSDAVVKAFHDGRGDGTLVAFVVPASGWQTDTAALRSHLAQRLPQHMVPADIVSLAAMPLNPAGKVDRKALQQPAAARPAAGPVPSAGTALERQLLAQWQGELGRPEMGLDDDFFALGGDSLAALALSVAAHKSGWPMRSADILAHPTVRRLAAALADRRPAPTHAVPDGRASQTAVVPLAAAQRRDFLQAHPELEDVRPLDPPQMGIYLHGLMASDKTAYVDQYGTDLHGPLDPDALARAWQHVVDRHPALRTAYLRRPFNQPVQAVHRQLPIDLRRMDLQAMDPAAQRAALGDALTADRSGGFDLACPPLMRLTLARLADERHRLVWTHHHIVVDGWSMTLVLQDVLTAYAALRRGHRPLLAAAPQAAPWTDWLLSHDIAPGIAFWRRLLQDFAGAPAWSTPAPAQPTRSFGQVDATMDAQATAALAREAAARGVTTTTLLQAAWARLLGECTGTDDVVFGVVTSGREVDVPDIERRVGLFVTSLPLRVNVRPQTDRPLSAWLRDLQQHAAEIRRHEDVPLGQVIKACDLPAGRPLFETLFVMSNYPGLDQVPDSGLTIEPADFTTQPAYPLNLILVPGQALGVRLVHDGRRFDAACTRRLAERFVALATALAQGIDIRSAG